MKAFLIISSINVVTYKEMFPFIKDGVVKYRPQRKYNFSGGSIAVSWYTTLDTPVIQPLLLTCRYNSDSYPKYDNYDAIEVSKTCEIPMDYDGVMGVPVTFLDKYCPNQFEIVDINPHFFTCIEQGLPKPKPLSLKSYGMKDPYARILIRHRK